MSENALTSAAIAASMASMVATLHVVRTLANNGLISPQDVDTIAHAITLPFEDIAKAGSEADAKVVQTIQGMVDHHIGGALAGIHRAARANWKGKS